MKMDRRQDPSDADRLEALARYDILDTEPEQGFDDIVLLATQICETPVGLVSLVANDRQWFKARIGFPASQTPLSQSVCAHALLQDDVLVIPDLTADARTRDNGLVTGSPYIRFYAGALLETPEGARLGTLCVIDTKPRPEGLSQAQLDSLRALARQVMSQMELRRAISQRDAALAEASAASAAFKRQQDLLGHELSHRLKNILAVVQSVVSQTLRNATSLQQAREAVSNRIQVLGKAHEILLESSSDSVGIAAIVEGAIKIHDDGLGHHIHLSGPAIEVDAKAALSLALVMHELATNAVKYGSLSVPDGAVSITWERTQNGPQPMMSLVWRESGGPPVVPPDRTGFGTRLIERALSGFAGGTVALAFPASGVECRIEAPLFEIGNPHRPGG